MRILHTADWHLGDRLGRINRTAELRLAVEQIAAACASEGVDVLLVAGDLFSDRCGHDGLRDTIEHLQRTFLPFLRRGGTMVALTGNHDHEGFCRTLTHTLNLAAPAPAVPGGLLPGGRLYLAVAPSFFRLKGRDGEEVQFVLMPYPTPARYLDGAGRFAGFAEKNRALQEAYVARLKAIQADPAFRADVPSVLGAHIHVQGAVLASPFRMSEAESIIVPEAAVPEGWAYVALGHIHQPQFLMRKPHIRYSGSIQRLDLGEKDDQKGVVLFDIDAGGLRQPPAWLPIEAAPIHRVTIANPGEDLPRLKQRYPVAVPDLVRFELAYTPGVDRLEDLLREIEAIFPNWYDRECRVAGAGAPMTSAAVAAQQGSVHDVVVGYLREQLAGQPDADAVLAMAEAFLAEDPA
ncbi:MAG TPA: metallophosphoesterase [Isosphaeraceae bacterium]